MFDLSFGSGIVHGRYRSHHKDDHHMFDFLRQYIDNILKNFFDILSSIFLSHHPQQLMISLLTCPSYLHRRSLPCHRCQKHRGCPADESYRQIPTLRGAKIGGCGDGLKEKNIRHGDDKRKSRTFTPTEAAFVNGTLKWATMVRRNLHLEEKIQKEVLNKLRA